MPAKARILFQEALALLSLCTFVLGREKRPWTVCFSLQVYREPAPEPLHHTEGILKLSYAISTENWKPKDLVRARVKLSEYLAFGPKLSE